MNRNLLEIKNLKKNFQHKNGVISVLKKVDINIKRGALVSLVGPSGSGKSTFLHILALLDKPTSGKIFFLGKEVKNLSIEKINDLRRNKISIIFQNNNLLSDFNTLENVLMPLIIRGIDYKLATRKAKETLKNVRLLNRLNHYPNELSGGEQQRVAIARSLIAETDLILADEPTGNLDFNTAKDVFAYFLKLKKLKKTVIFATHNRELADMADYKLSISNGIIKRVNA